MKKTTTYTAMATWMLASVLCVAASGASAADCRSVTRLVGVEAADGSPVAVGDAVEGYADLRDGNGEIGQTLKITVANLFPNRAYNIFINGKRVDLGVDSLGVDNKFTTAGSGNGTIVLGVAPNAIAPIDPVLYPDGISKLDLEIRAAGHVRLRSQSGLLCVPHV